jgi:hypothetical protein
MPVVIPFGGNVWVDHNTLRNISNVIGWQSAGWAFDDTKHFRAVLH